MELKKVEAHETKEKEQLKKERNYFFAFKLSTSARYRFCQAIFTIGSSGKRADNNAKASCIVRLSALSSIVCNKERRFIFLVDSERKKQSGRFARQHNALGLLCQLRSISHALHVVECLPHCQAFSHSLRT